MHRPRTNHFVVHDDFGLAISRRIPHRDRRWDRCGLRWHFTQRLDQGLGKVVRGIPKRRAGVNFRTPAHVHGRGSEVLAYPHQGREFPGPGHDKTHKHTSLVPYPTISDPSARFPHPLCTTLPPNLVGQLSMRRLGLRHLCKIVWHQAVPPQSLASWTAWPCSHRPPSSQLPWHWHRQRHHRQHQHQWRHLHPQERYQPRSNSVSNCPGKGAQTPAATCTHQRPRTISRQGTLPTEL